MEFIRRNWDSLFRGKYFTVFFIVFFKLQVFDNRRTVLGNFEVSILGPG